MATPWRSKTCNFCGTGSKVFIEINVNIPDDKSEHPYTQTAMCWECWGELGINAAFIHNRMISEEAIS